MDNKKIFLVNLAKGHIGEDGAHLLGGLLLSSFASASFTRIDTVENERNCHIIFLDEFQNYTTGSIAGMIAELRKFKVSFVFAHQYISQLEPDIRNAVLGNVGTICCFTLGQTDARYMEREFSPVFSVEDFIIFPIIQSISNYSYKVKPHKVSLQELLLFMTLHIAEYMRVEDNYYQTNHSANYMKSPINYYGGKAKMLKHILPLIPKHSIYTECFAGGLSVFFAKEPARPKLLMTVTPLFQTSMRFWYIILILSGRE